MPSRAWVSELAALLTTGVVQDDPDILVGLARDQALLAPAGTAMALVRERSAEDGLQRFDSRTSAGSRLSRAALAPVWRASANAIDGCVVLSAAAMDRILRVNPATMIAVVEPGVINARLAAESPVTGSTTRPIRPAARSRASAETSPPTRAAPVASTTT